MLKEKQQLNCSSFIDSETRSAAMSFFESLGSPTSLGLFLCLKYKDDTAACSHSINPLLYTDHEVFRRDYLAASLLSKYSVGPSGHEEGRRKATIEKFFLCEDRLRLVARTFSNPVDRLTPAQLSQLEIAREKIYKIIGDGPDASSLEMDFAFGPGSSSSIPRRKAHPSNKFLSADVTSAALPLLEYFFRGVDLDRPKANVIESSRIEFVPKNFKSDRAIAVEPDWNIFFQKGLGRQLRRCLLKRANLDLDNGAEVHHRLAQEASINGMHATIDLSSASDSISTSLVRYLLPYKWFVALNTCRTDRIEHEGKVIPMRKFSSMGNGFTFELETLIFYVLAYSAIRSSGAHGHLSVFGDDIILPSAAVQDLFSILGVCGFIVNQDKSYADGLFRESCGGHFFDGIDTKPIYLKDPLSHDSERFKFCNKLRRASYRFYHTDVHNGLFAKPYANAKRRILRSFHIPEGYGDGGLVSHFDEVCPSAKRKQSRDVYKHPHGIEGFRVRCLLPVVQESSVDHGGMMIHKLRSLQLRRSLGGLFRYDSYRLKPLIDLDEIPTGNLVTYSSRVRYRVGQICVSRWLNPGDNI